MSASGRVVLVLVFGGLLLGTTGAGLAADLFTPLLPGLPGVDAFHCIVTNVGTRAVTVAVAAIDQSNLVVASRGPVVIGQGNFASAGFIASALHDDGRCVFEIQGSKTQIRAHLCIVNTSTGGTCQARADAY